MQLTLLPHSHSEFTRYRSACENLILQDFEYCLSRDTEQKLWDYHGKVNNLFRKELKQVGAMTTIALSMLMSSKFREGVGKKKPVEQRKASKHFLDFIKSSQRFYRGYIQRIAACFGGIPELEAVANRLTLSSRLSWLCQQQCNLTKSIIQPSRLMSRPKYPMNLAIRSSSLVIELSFGLGTSSDGGRLSL